MDESKVLSLPWNEDIVGSSSRPTRAVDPSIFITNRPLSSYANPSQHSIISISPDYAPILDIFGVEPTALLDKDVLEIGLGGGYSFSQAQESSSLLRMQYFGVDIIDPNSYDIQNPKTQKERNLMNLKKITAQYPDKFKSADATEGLPMNDNSVDICLACFSVPMYARNYRGALTAILEMIRVARERAIFTCSISTNPDKANLHPWYGTGSNQFSFNLRKLIFELEESGIESAITPYYVDGGRINSLDLNLTNKDSTALSQLIKL